uniref:Uncharacterized protein n=1 Tax=Arundo donax TaxID=35708 RepID=A0A0A9HFF9_ARUDO
MIAKKSDMYVYVSADYQLSSHTFEIPMVRICMYMYQHITYNLVTHFKNQRFTYVWTNSTQGSNKRHRISCLCQN